MKSGFCLLLISLVLMSVIKATMQERKKERRPFLPLVEEEDNQPQRPKYPKETAICERCTAMYKLAEKEHKELKNHTLFCIRLLQIDRCIMKIQKEHRFCNFIMILVLGTGVGWKQRNFNCSSMNINTNDIANIFKPIKLKRAGGRCRYRQPNRNLSKPMHCGMFGDPHLKTFYDVRQTCVVAGAWTLVDNEYLAVQVTNEIVQHTESTSATATSKISIVFKEQQRGCITQKIYEATSAFLPHVFKDGTSFSGERCKTLVLKRSSKEVVIRSCRTNTTIVIRKFGNYLTFNILTPYEIVNRSSGLCRTGCPANELVDYPAFFRNRINHVSTPGGRSSGEKAMSICANANLTDFYYDSCVFDLLTTGDRQFSEAATAAMIDAKNMDPRLRLRRENSVLLNVVMHPSSSARTLTYSNFLLFLLCLSSITTWLTGS